MRLSKNGLQIQKSHWQMIRGEFLTILSKKILLIRFLISISFRFNKMLPQKHFDKMEKVEKAAAELLNNAKPNPFKSKDIVEIKENTIDKHIKSTTVSDDEYDDDYDYNYPDDDIDSDTDADEIVTITPKVVSTTKCK